MGRNPVLRRSHAHSPARAPEPAAGAARLRVWHVNVGNHAGRVDGVAAVTTALARDQAGDGHDVRLVVAADPRHHDSIRDAAGPGVGLSLHGTPRAALGDVRRRIADPATRPDVVHLHSVFRPAHRLLAALARRRGIPVVLSPHAGLAPALMQRDRFRKELYGRLVERRFFRTADGVHTLQAVESEDVVTFCGADRPTVAIPNPMDRSLLDAPPWSLDRHGGASGAPRVVLLCRYDVYQKGLDRLDLIARTLPDVQFHVYGSTDRNQPERARALVAAAPANLRFEEPVHGETKLEVLRSADLFLQPSRVEGLSVSLVEAMALGVPCAVSGYVGRSLATAELGTAIVLHDEPAIAAGQVRALLADRPRRAGLGDAARTYARGRFAPDAVSAGHIAHYRRLIADRPIGQDRALP